MNNDDVLSGSNFAAAYHCPTMLCIQGIGYKVLFKQCFIYVFYADSSESSPAAHHKRCFSKAIPNHKRIGVKTVGLKSSTEILQCLATDRFSTINGHLPRTQIKLCTHQGADSAYTEFVGKVGSATYRSLVVRDSLKPAQRVLKKGGRGH